MIERPTLILCGQDDKWAPPQQHREMAEFVRGGRYVTIPECGHMSTLERSDAVNDALRAWLQTV
jgi:pimeloyl-ACP methyl ester carboxylesterase